MSHKSLNKYKTIVNPETGRKVNINGTIGKRVLKKYLKYGGADQGKTDYTIFWMTKGTKIISVMDECPNKELTIVDDEIIDKDFAKLVMKCMLENLKQSNQAPTPDMLTYLGKVTPTIENGKPVGKGFFPFIQDQILQKKLNNQSSWTSNWKTKKTTWNVPAPDGSDQGITGQETYNDFIKQFVEDLLSIFKTNYHDIYSNCYSTVSANLDYQCDKLCSEASDFEPLGKEELNQVQKSRKCFATNGLLTNCSNSRKGPQAPALPQAPVTPPVQLTTGNLWDDINEMYQYLFSEYSGPSLTISGSETDKNVTKLIVECIIATNKDKPIENEGNWKELLTYFEKIRLQLESVKQQNKGKFLSSNWKDTEVRWTIPYEDGDGSSVASYTDFVKENLQQFVEILFTGSPALIQDHQTCSASVMERVRCDSLCKSPNTNAPLGQVAINRLQSSRVCYNVDSNKQYQVGNCSSFRNPPAQVAGTRKPRKSQRSHSKGRRKSKKK